MPKILSKGFSPIVAFSRQERIPIHEQIADGLRQAISNGRIIAGTRLASSRVLADDWNVSRNTVLQVFETLGSEGYVTSHVGDGTYVSDIRTPPAPDAADPTEGMGQKLPNYPFRGLSRRGRTAVGEVKLAGAERPVPFLPNVPDSREFPMRSWLRLMNEVSGALTGDAPAGVTDGGYMPLRRAIAHHVAVTRGYRCDPDQVIITSGSQQGLDLVIRLLTDRGDPIWIEEPGYPGTQAVANAYGANVQLARVDQNGARIHEAIEGNLAPRLICLSPARQFPTGATLSPARRKHLLEFARQSGSWILEDDFDSEFHYVAPQPDTLAAQDSSNRVILMATFSTSLVPSLRMGYLVVPPDLIRPFGAARSVAHGHAPLLEQMVLAEMMNRGIYAAHLRRMRKLYKERQTCLATALKAELGYTVPNAEVESGMHIVLPLIKGANDVRLSQALAQSRIATQPLSPLFKGRYKKEGLLLGFAAFSEDRIRAVAPGLAPLMPFVDRMCGHDWRHDLFSTEDIHSVLAP